MACEVGKLGGQCGWITGVTTGCLLGVEGGASDSAGNATTWEGLTWAGGEVDGVYGRLSLLSGQNGMNLSRCCLLWSVTLTDPSTRTKYWCNYSRGTRHPPHVSFVPTPQGAMSQEHTCCMRSQSHERSWPPLLTWLKLKFGNGWLTSKCCSNSCKKFNSGFQFQLQFQFQGFQFQFHFQFHQCQFQFQF